MKARVWTGWTGDGTISSPYRPQLITEYSVGYTDVTAQPAANIIPSVNLFVIEITCDQATLTAIEADADYQVVWSEA